MAVQHLEEVPWTAQGDEKRKLVQGMFAEIAPGYDRLNSLMSMNLHRRWRQIAASYLQLKSGDSALDVCCGTGDFLVELRRIVGPKGHVAGIDFCAPMLDEAVKKGHRSLLLGDACQLPIAEGSFEGVSVGWGIRNVPDIDAAHSEIFRCLRSKGRFVSLDCAIPRNGLIRSVSLFVGKHILPLIGRMTKNPSAYKYLPESTKRFKSREELVELMQKAGFVDVGFRDLFFGNICIHWGQKP